MAPTGEAELHSLLARQLKRLLGGGEADSAEWRAFLDAVGDAYRQSDNDRGMLERVLDLTSQELLEANAEMSAMVEALRQSERDYRGLFEAAYDAILLLEPEEKTVLEANQRACGIYGFSHEEFVGLDLGRIADMTHARRRLRDIIARGSLPPFETVHRRRDGSEMHVEIYASVVHYKGRQAVLSINRDITERKRTEALIHHRAYHDDLTELPNRLLFRDRLQQALGQAGRTSQVLATLFLDLDRFKNINDTLGHAAGDRLLEEVARRLLESRRATDTVARLGGDEFLVLIQNLRHPEDAARIAESLLDALRPPIQLEGHELHVTASIGISLFPHDGGDVETLIKNSDVAMYWAKAEGRNTYRIYEPEMNARALEFLMLENGLRRALEQGEFALRYQPQVDAASGRVVGVEALARWHREDGTLLLPGEFIPLAEDTGQIQALGQWVLRTACRQSRDWLLAGQGPLRLAVNLSAHEFKRRGFVETIAETLAETAIDPGSLELELTESAIMKDLEKGIENLRRLREMGVRIAIDDFGTGTSSLANLKRLPVNTLKIDRAFIDDCCGDPRDGAIVAAIIDMAHSLDLNVIAEGVETAEQVELLRERGCDEMQGFYFSRPLAPEAFLDLLAGSARAPSAVGG